MHFTRLCALAVAAVASSASAQIIQDSSLLFHYDAADINADGFPEAIPANARISQWNDKSGAGRNLQRASLVNGATNSYADNIFYLPNAANGMPALHFGNQVNGTPPAGSVDYLLGPVLSGTQLGGAAGDQMTMFMVQRKHANVVHAQWDSTVQRLGFEGTARWDFVNGNATAPAGQYAPTVTTAQAPLIQGGQFVVYTAERTGATPPVGLVGSTQYVYINGTQEQKIQTATGLNLTAINQARWGFGGQNSGGNLAHVDFAEVIYYNRQLSIAERQQVESYLKKKYSIDTNSFAAGVYVNKAASVFNQYHGAYSISINGTGAEAADRLFDDATLTKLLVASTAVTPINIDVMFPTDRIPTIASYNIASANDVPGRDPKNWTFQGSNDGTTWTPLDTRTNEAFATRLLTKTYVLASAQTFRFYRLSITANNGDTTNTQFSEWGFNTATTNTNPTVTGAAGGLSGTVAEVAANLFDRKTDTKYLPSSNAALAVTVVMPVAETIRAYTVATANDVPGRDPRDFKLEGSNNGTTWTVLDTRTDVVWQARYQVREFNFTNSTAYTQYRFTVTKNWGEAATQASEVNLFPYSATTDSDGDGAADAREFQEFGNLTSVTSGDTDGDGLPDGYEFMNTSPRSTTALVASADADGDGRTNLQEFTAGTLPLVADSDNDGLNDGAEFTAGTNPLLADSDGDGLSDGDEVNTALTNPLVADSDLDGVSDAIERQLGYNPNSAASVPTFLPSIGVNLAETNLDLLQPYEVVGALGYRQANWNHLLPLNQTMAAGTVKDGAGAVVSGLSIGSTSAATNRARVSDHSNAFKRLMNGFFTDSTTADNPTLTFTGIPYSNYDVVIYTESETTNALMGGFKVVDPNNAATVYAQNSYFRALNSSIANLDSSFVLIDQTGGGPGSSVAGNTIVFRNLTQANIKIVARALANYSRSTIAAVQIVATNPAVDPDGDGLPDSLEISLFGDLTSQNGMTDADGDGRTNAQELAAGTSLMNTDSDGDGLSDGAEATAGTNPLLVDTDGDGDSDSTELNVAPLTNPLLADTDGDGVKDGAERFAGTNPNNVNSYPTFSNAIGVNFAETTNDFIGAGEVVGAGNYRQVNWMNVTGATGTNVACVNSAGTTVATTVTWATGAVTRVAGSLDPSPFATPTRRMLVGYLDDNGTAGNDNPIITFTGVPYSRYAMIVYAESSDTAGIPLGSYRVVDPAAVGVNIKGPGYIKSTSGLESSITLVENGAATAAAAVPANAIVFSNLTNANIRLIAKRESTPTATRAPVTAIQIVDMSTALDADSDGMSDNWEIFYFGTLQRPGSGDFDGDGLSDLSEYTAGTNPTLSDTDNDGLLDGEEATNGTNPLLADTDNDGLTDLQEKYLTTNSLVADTDGDGASDGREVALGSDPKVAGSTPPSGLLFYEAFSNKLYGAGSIAPQPLSSLYSPRSGTVINGASDVVENSLTYGPIAVNGGRFRHSNLGATTTAELYTTLDVSGTSTFAANGLVNGGYIGGSTTAQTVYVSFLYRSNRVARNSAGNLDGVAKSFFGFQTFRDTTEVTGMGESTASGTFGLFGPVVGDTPATPAFSTDNAVHLVVARIDFKSGANDDIKVWLDPNPLAAEAAQLASVPTSVKTAITDLSFNRLAWRGSTVDTDHNIEYDEIRIGTSWTAVLPTVSSALVINEFSATGGIEDEDGSDEDWIEIYNGGVSTVDLSGYQLKDSTSTWLFPTLTPAVTIQPGQHLIVFASSKDVTKRPAYTSSSVLHTNFKLSAAGEYLAFLDPANTVLSEFNPKFPVQQSGYSFGLKDGVYGFMQPTPRGANSSSYAAIPATLTVSQNSGVFTAPFSVSITGQAPGQLVRYTLDGTIPSIGNGFTYAAPVTISSTAQFRCRVAQPGVEGPISSEVYLFPANGAQIDAAASYTIPIVVVDTSGRTIQAGDGNTHEWPTQCSYVIYENVPPTGVSLANTPPTLFSRGQIGVRGKTSSGEVKKPYGVKFFQEENDDDKARSVFGLPSASSWVLYAPDSFDKSGLRNVLMYELSRQMGQWAPNTRLVELYVNTSGGSLTNASYQGLYVFMEKPDRNKDRVNVQEITPYQNTGTDVTGGYIFQINKLYVTPPTDLRVGSGTYVPSTGADILVEYPNEADTTVAQRTYLNNLVNEIEDTINANPGGAPTYTHPTTGLHYRDYIDVPSWVDHHILNVAANNVDGLRLSAKMYKPRNGKVFAGPVWDFDRSIDSNDPRDDNPLAWVGTSDATKFFRYGWWKAHNDPAGASTSPNGLAHGLLKDPDFMQTWVDRWKAIRTTGQPMTDANINALLDAWQAQIFPSGATTATQCPANRNITKWAAVNTPRSFPAIGLNTAGLYSNEVGVMKDWMQKHLAFIDGNIVKAPAFSAPSGVITDSTPITLSSADHSPGTTKLFFTIDGSDPRPSGGAAPIANGTTLFEYTAPFTLPTGHYVVKSRVYNPTLAAFDETVTTTKMSGWSGLSETYYFSDAAPAAAGNLVVSELMYHPLDPSPAEITAGFTDSDQFEFIELLNVGATPIDLYESLFTSGVDYHFSNGTIPQLAPGQRMLVVKNVAAFTMRYGATAAALIAGQFEGNDNLNNDGETITIVDRLGAVILSFTYDDIAPWPTDADGLGRSLVLKRPSTLSDHSLVTSWRASAVIGGEPGGVDSRSFLGIATNDTDGDGYSALLEYAAGTSDSNSASNPGFTWGVVADGAQNYLSVTFVADLRADDISITAQRTADLAGAWVNGIGDIIELSRIPNTATGFVTITFRSAVPYASTQAEFMRIQVTKP